MNEQKRGVTMRHPATRWQDALPTRSGVVGALMCGQIQRDTIVLNDDALYQPKGKVELVDVSDQLPELHRLIDVGQYKDAAELMPNAYSERTGVESGSTSSLAGLYQPFCAIHLRT